MPTNTFIALKSTTVTTATPTITFTDIPDTYTDLVLMSNSKCSNTSTGASITIRFNSDSAGNYSQTSINASGSSRITERYANTTGIDGGRINTSNSSNSNWGQAITHIQNYASTSYHKMCLSRSSVTNEAWKQYQAGSLWRNSSSKISTITITCGYDFLAGSTFSLYGVKAWSNESTPKATGGQVFQDSTYWYHAFLSTGTFTPSTNLTNVEFVVVAGGGGGGENAGSPGGAGGYRSSVVGEMSGGGASAQSRISMNSGTAYTITVGGGGAGNAIDNGGRKRGAQGSSSSISGSGLTTISCTGGGYGTSSGFPTPTDSGNGGNGGSGGGGTGYGGGDPNGSGGSGTTGEGYGGGAVSVGGSQLGVGGGGGAGAAGGAATGSGTVSTGGYQQGNGGIGVLTQLAVVTKTGEAGYLAGGGAAGEIGVPGLGGGGGPTRLNYRALANTGGGGGGGDAGGSGIVIIRYAKA